jgi:hypothetical protein
MRVAVRNDGAVAPFAAAEPVSCPPLTLVLDAATAEVSASQPAPRGRFRAALAWLMSSLVEGLAAYGHAMHPCADFYYTHPDYWDALQDEGRWSETRFGPGERVTSDDWGLTEGGFRRW